MTEFFCCAVRSYRRQTVGLQYARSTRDFMSFGQEI